MTVAVNGTPFLAVGILLGMELLIGAGYPVTQVSCALAVGRVRRRVVETAASTVEILIVILSCLGRIGSGDRIHVAVRWWGDYFFGLNCLARANNRFFSNSTSLCVRMRTRKANAKSNATATDKYGVLRFAQDDRFEGCRLVI